MGKNVINVVAIVLPFRDSCFFHGCIAMLNVSTEGIDVLLYNLEGQLLSFLLFFLFCSYSELKNHNL